MKREEIDRIKYYYEVELKDEAFDFLEIAIMQIALEKIKVNNKEIQELSVDYFDRGFYKKTNSVLSEFEKRFVLLANELGHAILNPKSSCFFINENNYISNIKSEYEANIFAAEFLIDDMAVDRLYWDGFSLEQLASSYYIPIEIVKLKFNNI